ncbi:hypothetical protein ACJX0J_008938, partial [Zea mays]
PNSGNIFPFFLALNRRIYNLIVLDAILRPSKMATPHYVCAYLFLQGFLIIVLIKVFTCFLFVAQKDCEDESTKIAFGNLRSEKAKIMLYLEKEADAKRIANLEYALFELCTV